MVTTATAAPPRPTEKAEAWSGIRDIDVQIGEAAPGQQWPGGPYRKAEWVAIAAIAGPTLWWVDSHPAGTTLYALGIGLALCVVTVVTMRMLLPRGRPSLSTRAVFARNTFRPPHVITSHTNGRAAGLRTDASLDPPEHVEGNLVFTAGGVYAEFLIDGLSVSMRSLNVHRRAAQLTRNLGRYLPSGSQLRGLLVAEDQRAILRAMVGPHTNNSAWIRQCRHWIPVIANPNKWDGDDFYGPVRPRFWLTVPVDAGVEGRTPLGQGRRAWDWVSGRDKDSDKSIQHYAATARKIIKALPNDFNIRAATPAQILWYRRHRTMLGVIHEPIPPAGVGPAGLSARDFPRTAFDEGDNAENPRWRPSFAPVVRVYDPDNPARPASYQTFLTVEHFPESGLAFPRAAYLNALLNVNTQASIEWTQHINIRTPDDAKALNYRNTKNIQDQMLQRGQRGAESDELPRKLSRTRAYTSHLNANPAERELDHTVIIAVGAASPDVLDDAVKQIRQELDTVGIAVKRRRGSHTLLWKAFNTGSENGCYLDEFRIPTSADKWSLFLPLISGRVGNIRGSALAVDQTTMRPSIILHDPEGTARRNKNTGLAVIGDPGGGKSNRTKLSAFELILRGGRVVVFEPDTIAEWRNALLGRVSRPTLLQLIQKAADPDRVANSSRRTTLDTLLYLGTSIFNGRAAFTELPVAIQADIKHCFPSYREACARADRLLAKIRDDNYIRGAMQNSPGKMTATALYVQRRAVTSMPVVLRLYEHCGFVATGRPEGWNMLKLAHRGRRVSWSNYPEFDTEPHPRLNWTYGVEMSTLEGNFQNFADRANRPLLHRKEEFLAPDDPAVSKYRRLTASEVRAGLYANPTHIGLEDGWAAELDRCGVALKGHRLVKQCRSVDGTDGS
jgi:hypothetical protein